MTELGPVLVTGAGGFIGSAVARALSGQTEVIAATRDGRNRTRQLDLREGATLEERLTGAGAIVHCAVGDRQVTVDGTRRLLEAAARAGVRRVVHLSSVAVYGAAEGEVGEDTAMVSPGVGGYAGWKAAAELACLQAQGLEVVRLRPSIVYGPGSKLWVDGLARRIRSGRWGVFGEQGEGFCNLVHVRDVANAVVRAISAKDAPGRALNVNGSGRLTWNEWFVAFGRTIEAPELRDISPLRLRLRVATSLPVKAIARISPNFAADWRLGAPARSELALFALRAHYPTGAARDVLGWEPVIGWQDGLAECAEWLRRGGGEGTASASM